MSADECLMMSEESLALEATMFPATKEPTREMVQAYGAWLWHHDVEQLDLLAFDTAALWSTIPAITLEFVTHAYYLYMLTGKHPEWFFREMALSDPTNAIWTSLIADYKWYHSHMSMYYNVFFNAEAPMMVTWGHGSEMWKPRTYTLRANVPNAPILACFGSTDHWRLGGVSGISVPVNLMHKIVHPVVNAIFTRLLSRQENLLIAPAGLLQFERLKNRDCAGKHAYRVYAGPNRYMRTVCVEYVGKLAPKFELVDHAACVFSGRIGFQEAKGEKLDKVGCEALSITRGMGDVECSNANSFAAPAGFFPQLIPNALQHRGLSRIKTHLDIEDLKLRLQLTTNLLEVERKQVGELREMIENQRYLIEGLSTRINTIEHSSATVDDICSLPAGAQ